MFIGHSLGGLVIKQVGVVLARVPSFTKFLIGVSVGRPW